RPERSPPSENGQHDREAAVQGSGGSQGHDAGRNPQHPGSPVNSGRPGEVMKAGIRQDSMLPSGETTTRATAVVEPGTEKLGHTKLPRLHATGTPSTTSRGWRRWG